MPTMSCIEEHASVIDSPFNFLSNVTATEMIRNNAEICMKKHEIDVQAINQCSDRSSMNQFQAVNLTAPLQRSRHFYAQSCYPGDSRFEGRHYFYNCKANQSSQPKLEYAPWVVVDGAPLKEDAYRSDLDVLFSLSYTDCEISLKEYICKAYLGPQPEACDPLRLKDFFPVHQLASRAARTRLEILTVSFQADSVLKEFVGLSSAQGHRVLLQSS